MFVSFVILFPVFELITGVCGNMHNLSTLLSSVISMIPVFKSIVQYYVFVYLCQN